MKYENRKEQHYAVSKGGVLVHINDAHDSKEDCFCPHCGSRMLKRCGNIRAWHFAHDYRFENEFNKKCSYESYLHSFAKLKLKQWFEESESILLHYQQPVVCKYSTDCNWKGNGNECSRLEEKTVDLKTYLTVCRLEEIVHVNDDRFRADLLWCNPYNSKNDILIEIKVTHECTQKKKDSHKRIIEFEVHSEQDVENIVNNNIQECDTVKFYGFTPKEIVDEAMPARYSLSKFIYYRTGKAFAGSACDCKTFRNRRKSALLEVTIMENRHSLGVLFGQERSPEAFSLGRFCNWGLALAKSKGFDVRNCCLCIHRHYDYEEEKFTCELKPDEPFEVSHAISCGNYKLEEDFYHKNLNDFNRFSQNNKVDVWSKT